MAALSDEVALRIALAARALPDMEVRDLLVGILSLVGEPLSTAKLNKLRMGKLKRLDSLAEIDEQSLMAALGYLKGRDIVREPDPLPEIQAYEDGAMPGSIRVACASNNGDRIDAHFGSCARFLVYQLSAEEVRLIDIRVPGAVGAEDDKNALRAQLINDCQVLYTISIGGPAAAKAVRAGLHPIKLPQGGVAPDILQRLCEAIAESPPPWLAKAMGIEPEQRVRFREEANG